MNRQLTEKLPDDLGPVIQSGMCIACGACIAADPEVNLVMDKERLLYRPDRVSDARAASVCPAIQVDFDALHTMLFPGDSISEHGVVHSVLLAQSTDHERNLNASSGGVIKELLRAYLAMPEVDGIISLNHVSGLNYRPMLIESVEQVDKLPGSVYHNLPLDNALTIIRENEGRFVLTGIPCQLEGIFNYIVKIEPALMDRIHATIGLVCGWNYSHHSLRAICDYKGIDYDRIDDISYRGGGPVGKLKITSGGQLHEVHRRVDFSYQVAFDRSFNIPRCHSCVNHVNFLADIVVGDAWLPSTIGTRSGVSIVICRRESSHDMMLSLKAAGRVEITEVGTDEITESQSHSITFGDFSYAYNEYLLQNDRHVPSMDGPNRRSAKLVMNGKIEAFDRELQYKQQLQNRGLYNRLWWRKMTIEFYPFLARYFRWFETRILKYRSLTNAHKKTTKTKTALFR